MKMRIQRWGDSLAVRLPAALVDRFTLKEGDEIDSEGVEAALAQAESDDIERRRDEALERIKAHRRPLPPNYKFDREEANAR